jgi:predicted HNH restriction endonuclease
MKAKSNKNISTDQELIIICPNCSRCMIKVKNGSYSTEQISGKYNSLMLNRESKKKSQKVLEKDANSILKMP